MTGSPRSADGPHRGPTGAATGKGFFGWWWGEGRGHKNLKRLKSFEDSFFLKRNVKYITGMIPTRHLNRLKTAIKN